MSKGFTSVQFATAVLAVGASLAVALTFFRFGPAPAAALATLPLALAITAMVLTVRRESGLMAGIVLALALPVWWQVGPQQASIFRLAAVLALLTVMMTRWRPRPTLPDVLLAGFTADVLISGIIETGQPGLGRLMINSLAPLAFYGAARCVPVQVHRRVLIVIVVAATLGALTVIYEGLRGSVVFADLQSYSWLPTSETLFRPGGVYGSPPAAGLVMTLALLLLQPLVSSTRGLQRLCWIGCGLVMVVALVLTLHRTAFIALAVGVVLYKIINLRSARTAVWYGVVAATLVLLASLLLPTVRSNRTFQQGITRAGDLQAREAIWRQALPVVTSDTHTAIFGVGFGRTELARSNGGTISAAIGRAPELVSDSIHNQYVLTLLEQGLIGLLLFVGFLFSVTGSGLRSARRYGDPLTAALSSAVIALCVISFTGTPVLEPGSWIIILVVTGMLTTRVGETGRVTAGDPSARQLWRSPAAPLPEQPQSA
jgi:O-antigen ligase